MKYLVLLIVVLVVVYAIRSGRKLDRPADAAAKRPGPPPAPQDMVECPVCRVHLPRTDALAAPDGRLYCCAEHRARAGG